MRPRRLVAAAAVATLALTGMPLASAAAAGSNGDVPVLGTVSYSPNNNGTYGVLRGVVHGVRRVDGGTVVYYSIGTNDAQAVKHGGLAWFKKVDILGGYGLYDAAQVNLIDPTGLKRYLPMMAGDTCLCSSIRDMPGERELGLLYSGYAVMPPLPADVTTVTFRGFFGATVANIPVTDGLLEPAATPASSFVNLKDGWPTVPVDQIASVQSPAQYILPLTKRTSDIKQTVRKAESKEKVQVDLGADVLFAVDSAKLTADAKDTLDALGKDIAERAAGVVTIVGHTDSTGSTSHNQTLSQQRAQSVLVALKAAAPGAKVTYAATGKGESDPVADNATAAGRQLNRRVTVTYSVEDK